MFRNQLASRCLVIGLLLLGLAAARGAAVTNVTPVNVTPTSFGVLCRSPYALSVALYADAAGASNVTSQLAVEYFPVTTGNPDLQAGYSRRQSQHQLRELTQALGFAHFHVNGCKPNTTYYYRLFNGATPVYPTSGVLPEVTTEQENAFVIDDQQLILDIPGLNNLGRVVTLTHTNASYALAAVMGDGVGTNQVFFNLNDLFQLASHQNFIPVTSQTFDVKVWDFGSADLTAQFTINFTPNFRSGQGNVAAIGTEYLALSIGSAVLQTGNTTNVPVRINTSSGLASVDVTMTVAPGHLSGLGLTSLAAEIDPVAVKVTVQSASNVVLHLPARTGQAISGNKDLARFSFTASQGQPSAFVPLTVKDVAAARPGGSIMTNLTLASGRVVIVGRESLLEIASPTNKSAGMILYANPNLSYALEYTTNMGPGAVWTRLTPMAITSLVSAVSGLDTRVNPIYYRAVEFNADPPYVQANRNPDGSRFLTLFGKPGAGYVLEYSGGINTSNWTALTYIPLTVPFTNVPVADQGTVFYRAGELVGSAPVMNLVRNPDGSADVTLFGRPGYAYLLQSAPTGTPAARTTLERVLMDKAFTNLHLSNVTNNLITAIEYAPDPSVLELAPTGNGTAMLRLFGKPGSAYRIDSTESLGLSPDWKAMLQLPLETSFANVQSVRLTQQPMFFRASEIIAEVPVVEALVNPDHSRKLLVYGRSSRSYTVEYTTDFSNSPTWHPLVTNVFTKSFDYINVTNEVSPIFYRVRQN